MNKNSSRSHSIFTIYVEAHSRTLSDEKYVTSKINLVDLAGSERLGKSGSEGRVLKEATYINKSLSFLEQAIIALGDQKREHIPFRQCKLTHALKDSLGGNCNMALVTNIYGEAAQLEETVRKDSQCNQAGFPPRGWQGWVRLAQGWLSWHTSLAMHIVKSRGIQG